ncbi:hypothetical protein WR25_02209 [Diploscapter pachys]|uniref:Cation efflux protein transmembrane domain-containing protein n=1 Tax=Diploscapter pachys TaxID=2018661 RepID=A0A2A2J9L1_9BILA|nr:hypothetical protein WR25_02209 [Diploscapter pachys]
MSSDPVLVLSVTELESTSEDVVKPTGKKNAQEHEHEHGHSHGHGHSHNGGDNHGHSHSHVHPKPKPVAHSHVHKNGGAFQLERQMSCFSYRYSMDETGRAKCIDLEKDAESSESGGSHDDAEHGHSHGGPSSVKKGRGAEKVLWAVAALSAVFICAELTGGIIAKSLAIATDIDAKVMLITACCGIGFNIVMALVLHFGSKSSGQHLHSHAGGGSHGHSHDGTGSVNVRAALIHVIGDFVQSIGVLIAALVIWFTNWTLADPICTFFFSIIVLFTTITVARDIFVVLMEG